MSEYQRCPACNQLVPVERQFCDFCGTKLTNTVETTISYPTIKQENTVVTETNNIQENSVEETPKANTEENKKPYNNTNNQDEKHNTRKVFIIAAIVIAVLTGVTLIVGNQIDKKNKNANTRLLLFNIKT